MKPLALYVHIPFCTVKCGYCDFNAYAGLDSLKEQYGEAVLVELGTWESVLRGRTVTSIAFGGGTPGEVPPAHIAAIIAKAGGLATILPGAEIGLEANPGTTSLRDLAALQASGVNRISFGAQSFNAAELKFLDRIHSPEAIAASVANARRAGIENIGLDLIYGLPGQAMGSWEGSLRSALALKPAHLSLYALTVEEGTLLGRKVREGKVAAPDGDLAAEMYERATDMLAGAGFAQYELSNWARPGFESRHNRVYWTDGDYLGIGAGAHGYLDGERYENIAHPRAYVQALQAGGHADRPAVASAYRPAPATAMFDWLSLGLRLTGGVEESAFARRFGASISETVGPPLAECEAAGLVTFEGGRVRLTRGGRPLHGEVSVRLLAHLREGEKAAAGGGA